MIEHTTGGDMSLAELAAHSHTAPSTILRLTAKHSPGAAYPKTSATTSTGCSGAPSPTTATFPQGCASTRLLDPPPGGGGPRARVAPIRQPSPICVGVARGCPQPHTGAHRSRQGTSDLGLGS